MLANAMDAGMFLIKAIKSYETWKAYYYSALSLRDPEGVVVRRMTEDEAKQRARNITGWIGRKNSPEELERKEIYEQHFLERQRRI
jgi:Tfp pilus assembly protein PilP